MVFYPKYCNIGTIAENSVYLEIKYSNVFSSMSSRSSNREITQFFKL